MAFLLMDLASRNVLDSFASEADALDYVRETIEAFGPDTVMTWSLGPVDRSSPPVSGERLVARARAHAHV